MTSADVHKAGRLAATLSTVGPDTVFSYLPGYDGPAVATTLPLGMTVTRATIVEEIADFARAYRDPGSFDRWLDARTYKYAVWHERRPYPPKRILSDATGIPTWRFSGGEQTNRVFRRLGFEVTRKPEAG